MKISREQAFYYYMFSHSTFFSLCLSLSLSYAHTHLFLFLYFALYGSSPLPLPLYLLFFPLYLLFFPLQITSCILLILILFYIIFFLSFIHLSYDYLFCYTAVRELATAGCLVRLSMISALEGLIEAEIPEKFQIEVLALVISASKDQVSTNVRSYT